MKSLEPRSAPVAGPQWLYLHGFASGPDSTKGRAIAAQLAELGIALQRIDLRVPNFESQRLSAMIEVVRDVIGSPHDRAVVLGSSMGALVAARAAERDPRIFALVLLAPAFRLAARWREGMTRERLEAWEEQGWMEQEDYAEKRMRRIDFEFLKDAERVDQAGAGWPDVRVPTLILHGRHDQVVPIELSHRWAAPRRWVRVVELDDGHDLVASLPSIVAHIKEFLAAILVERGAGASANRVTERVPMPPRTGA